MFNEHPSLISCIVGLFLGLIISIFKSILNNSLWCNDCMIKYYYLWMMISYIIYYTCVYMFINKLHNSKIDRLYVLIQLHVMVGRYIILDKIILV